MPYRPAKPCCRRGCPRLTHGRFCEPHEQDEQRAYNLTRGTARERGYDGAWRRVRAQVLAEEPYCRCGCGLPSTQVDHITPLRRGGSNERANLQALAKSCHSRKTAMQDGRWTRRIAQ